MKVKGVELMFEIDKLLKEVKRVHFIGIGGSGMCPLAEILHNEGYHLSGSDNNETDTLARIRDMGIPVTLGQKAENIDGAEMIRREGAYVSHKTTNRVFSWGQFRRGICLFV